MNSRCRLFFVLYFLLNFTDVGIILLIGHILRVKPSSGSGCRGEAGTGAAGVRSGHSPTPGLGVPMTRSHALQSVQTVSRQSSLRLVSERPPLPSALCPVALAFPSAFIFRDPPKPAVSLGDRTWAEAAEGRGSLSCPCWKGLVGMGLSLSCHQSSCILLRLFKGQLSPAFSPACTVSVPGRPALSSLFRHFCLRWA